MARISLSDFSTNNPLYAGASVGVLAVTEDEEEQFLPLYADATGDGVLPNPQVLNAEGRWAQPIYVEQDYRLSISGAGFEDHTTGITTLGVLLIKAGDGIGINAEKGVVEVRVQTPFTADEKQKLASIAAFNLWRDVQEAIGDALANDDRFMVGDASDPDHGNKFLTGAQLKAFIGALAGSFHLFNSVLNDIGTDIDDDDHMLIGDNTAIGKDNKFAKISNLKKLFASRFAAAEESGDYTIVDGDYGKSFFYDTSAASRTLTLPSRTADDAGFRFWVLKTSAANALTVAPDGADTINGASDFNLTRRREAAFVAWTGSEWFVLSHDVPGLSGFDLYEEVATALMGAIADNDIFALADVSEGGEPNRRVTGAQLKSYVATDKFVTLPYGPSIAWSLAPFTQYELTLEGSTTFQDPTNAKKGSIYLLWVHQDATGNRRITAWGNGYNFGTESQPILSTAGGTTDLLSFLWTGAEMAFLSINKGF